MPALLVFLGVGMLAGSDGLGIQFSDPLKAQFIGVVALSIILFSGGMDTKFSEVKPVLKESISLATVGVLLTTLVAGTFIYFITGFVNAYQNLTFTASLLLATIMSSTDSASVFSILRGKKLRLKQNLGSVLELESGSNDAMAYMLTIILISFIQTAGMSFSDALIALVTELAVGCGIGYLLGKVSVWIINRIHLDNHSLYPIMVLATIFFTFSLTTMYHGNGYLAVYIAGLIVGNSKIVHKKSIANFFDGFAWLWQIVMFLALGLLVNPHDLLPVAGVGLTIGLFLIFIARPISVFACLLPFRSITAKGKLYLSWVGLRGAVPIIFATYPMIAGVPHASFIFNVVFFITILSLTLQGMTVAPVAHWLGLVDEPLKESAFPIELPEEIKSSICEVELTPTVLEHGNTLMEMDLPDETVVVMINRDGKFLIPRGSTELMVGDKLLIVSDNDEDLRKSYEAMGVQEGYVIKKN